MFIDNSCKDFSELLASSSPTPGGGGACAMVGAFGAALGNMVGSLTVGNKNYAAFEEEIKDLMKAANDIRVELLDAVQQDAEAFEPLSQAYRIKAETEEEIKHKEEIMEAALKTAAQPPLKIMELCVKAIPLMQIFARKGSTLAVSDAGVGALFCKAAVQGAYLNVIINTKMMKDRVYAEEKEVLATKLRDNAVCEADKIYEYVCGALK